MGPSLVEVFELWFRHIRSKDVRGEFEVESRDGRRWGIVEYSSISSFATYHMWALSTSSEQNFHGK